MKDTIWKKDFSLMLLGQIISIFGNSVLRFALPLYLLDQTGSSALFGAVSAFAFLPMVLLSPVGGIVADRVNKQRIMVVLDFFTSLLILGFALLEGKAPLVPLMMSVMILLYGIQGAYQPAVQASLPLLVSGEKLMTANAAVTQVNSLASLLGPVLGGILYGGFGLVPILWVSCGCFFVSAVMELFIRIPHVRQAAQQSVWGIVRSDMSQSFRFIMKDQPVMGKAVLIICGFNLFLSAMLIIGMPVIITQILGLSSELYGYSQGAMAAGGLAGGLLAGILGNKLRIQKAHKLLLLCAAAILPMGLTLLLGLPVMVSYFIMTAMSSLIMAASTIFSIQTMAFVQLETPPEITGKVISCLMAMAMCTQPLGQAMYGALFQYVPPAAVILFAAAASLVITLFSRKIFSRI